MITIDELIEALDRQKVELELPAPRKQLIYNAADRADFREKLAQARKLRSEGQSVELVAARQK
jgi:hypothetical protein